MSPPNRAAFEGQQRLRAGNNFKTERAGDRKPFRPKPWTHQTSLAQGRGKTIEIIFASARDGFSGTLLNADQFAIEVEVSNPDATYKSVLTVFKHDIRHFRVLP